MIEDEQMKHKQTRMRLVRPLWALIAGLALWVGVVGFGAIHGHTHWASGSTAHAEELETDSWPLAGAATMVPPATERVRAAAIGSEAPTGGPPRRCLSLLWKRLTLAAEV